MVKGISSSLWDTVAEQEEEYGSVNTDEIDWGQDIGNEVID